MRIVLTLLLYLILFAIQSCKAKDHQINGWELVWSDEFKSSEIDLSSWTFDIGTGAPSFEEYGVSSPYFAPKNFPNDLITITLSLQLSNLKDMSGVPSMNDSSRIKNPFAFLIFSNSSSRYLG